MNHTPYPNTEIHNSILKTFLDLGLSSLGYEARFDTHINANVWTYRFKKSSSPIKVEFTVVYPYSSMCSLYFIENEKKYFHLDRYLKFKQDDTLVRLEKESFPHEKTIENNQFILDYLKVAKDVIDRELSKVVSGEEWIEVPFDWSITGR